MVEKSNLEKVSDKILKKIIKNIMSDFEDSSSDYEDVYEFTDAYAIYENNIKRLGVGHDTIDVDYIYTIIMENDESVLDDPKVPLKRPKSEEYVQDVQVSERVYQTNTYRLFLSSYSSRNVSKMLQFQENEGIISIYDGHMMDTDVHDTESYDYTYLKPYKRD